MGLIKIIKKIFFLKNKQDIIDKQEIIYDNKIIEKLRKLNGLLEQKLITQEEYKQKKDDILNSL